MQIDSNITFDQLLKIIQNLPEQQLNKLKQEIEYSSSRQNEQNKLESLLMNGPVASDEEINRIEENKKNIAQWRKDKS